MTNQKKEELLACPFCGGEAHTDHNRIYCSMCGCMPGILDTSKDSFNEHKRLWNTRLGVSAGNKLDEDKLEKIISKFVNCNKRAYGWASGEKSTPDDTRLLAKLICDHLTTPKPEGVNGRLINVLNAIVKDSETWKNWKTDDTVSINVIVASIRDIFEQALAEAKEERNL